jgi:hydroxypyruvate reductase/glycerate 2-kinase
MTVRETANAVGIVTRMSDAARLRRDARAIWDAAVAAARPEPLMARAVADHLADAAAARRVLVVGGGKAGGAMAAGLEAALGDALTKVEGVVNVPDGPRPATQRIRLHVARPAGSNQPTAAGVAGVEQMLALVAGAGPDDLAVCLLSGGGSALLPAPAGGLTLADKQAVTQLLHESGATIAEMNAVRKHLSRVKGGGVAAASRAGRLVSLVISDVVGDPLDVIASGPTAADPTTFADALGVLDRYRLKDRVPTSVLQQLQRGVAGVVAETIKAIPPHVENVVIGNNSLALARAEFVAEGLGYYPVRLGNPVVGECQSQAAEVVARVRHYWRETKGRVCILFGGETTVTLPPDHGRGGRNTEFVLAALLQLAAKNDRDWAVLSGGTDGEDGPTDAAGALADAGTFARAHTLGLDAADFLRRHDSYTFFAATGDLIKTGLTGTNVMDVGVVLVDAAGPAR